MAPIRHQKTHEVSPLPLADFFWIAGLDSAELLNTYIKLGESTHLSNGLHTQGAEDIIREDEDAEEVSSILESARPRSPHSKRNSYGRLSRTSGEAQISIQSSGATKSNRSSTTIRAVHTSSPHSSMLLSDADFDTALRKFTTDRDSFFIDLNFSAGAMTKATRPRPRPKTQIIVPEELQPSLSRGFGSIRRHISFRETNSMKRQPSIAREVSVRTSRRASNYNSVIPVPQAFDVSPNTHPLRRMFEPALLDRYPPRGMLENSKCRGNFPDFVPMFAFPNDINVISADSRPRPTWHGFSMTGADNSRIHAICIIVWIPMNPKAAEELEKRCEEWRRTNMSGAERELAGSLGERLAAERAKLSQLLSRLPNALSGSQERDELDEEISAVEEKIVMMTDMLRPLRHGAASKIEGLTDGDTGLWIPRAYGVLGRDASMTSFWKEWLRAVVVPMSDGAVLRVPPSSPKVGIWLPLERYVINLCTEAPSPISSKTQIELNIRELRLFARKEATNELPGSRTTDLYPLFRALTIPNIMVLFEYILSESRIILLSSHTSMLHLVSKAMLELIWPLKWAGVFIPVLPVRLVQALEAPCPYICGVERRYEKLELPEDDFVLVDLDNNEIQSTASPTPVPRQQRRKLMSLLQLAAPHHNRFGVTPGPPLYAVDVFPFDAFASENDSVFTPQAQSTSLAKLMAISSTSFGSQAAAEGPRRNIVLNAFLQSKTAHSRGGDNRPRTGSSSRTSNPDSPDPSPVSGSFPPLPATPVSRNDSGFALQSSLREKRSGYFDSSSKKGEYNGLSRKRASRKPSLPFLGHSSNLSIAVINSELRGTSTYAPSTYAQSTLAASTIMPLALMQPVHNTDTTHWQEGHCLQWRPHDGRSNCTVCDEKADHGVFRCSGCGAAVHGGCAAQICIVCPAAFFPDQIRAAFARCFAGLFYTYRKYMQPPIPDQMKNGMIYHFNMNEFLRSLPHENADYLAVLRQTQAFNEFISERERTLPAQSPVSSPSEVEASIALFDSIILSKRDRGRLRPGIPTLTLNRNPFSSRLFSAPFQEDFLHDTSEHLWRSASASSSAANSMKPDFGDGSGRSYHDIVTRIPAKLEEKLMKEPRMIQGVPRITERTQRASRKPLPIGVLREKINGLALNAPDTSKSNRKAQ